MDIINQQNYLGGVRFSESNNYGNEQFIISIDGDKECYLETIKTLLTVVGNLPTEMISQSDLHYMTNLITGMLPSFKQILSIDEINAKIKLENDYSDSLELIDELNSKIEMQNVIINNKQELINAKEELIGLMKDQKKSEVQKV